jgi:hypothetical protein
MQLNFSQFYSGSDIFINWRTDLPEFTPCRFLAKRMAFTLQQTDSRKLIDRRPHHFFRRLPDRKNQVPFQISFLSNY